jgi:hypothetical protein
LSWPLWSVFDGSGMLLVVVEPVHFSYHPSWRLDWVSWFTYAQHRMNVRPQSDPTSSFIISSHSSLSSCTPATLPHRLRMLLTSSHSFCACTSCPSSSMLRRRRGASRTHLTVSLCFFLFCCSSSDICFSCSSLSIFIWMPRPPGWGWRLCIEDDSEAAVWAMCDMAGPRVCVVGVRGSMLPRMRRMVLVAESSLE